MSTSGSDTSPADAPLPRLADAGWRAAMYCLHPRLILWSVLPLVLMLLLALALGWLFWDSAVQALRAGMEGWGWLESTLGWFNRMGLPSARDWIAPLLIILMAIPLIVVGSLLAVALLVTPQIVTLVAQRRFPQAHRAHGASFWHSAAWSLGHTVVALVLLAVSLPFWLIPPLILLLPPLIWGWLTYRVLAFDALADHASAAERKALLRAHRWPLLGLGVLCGYLGAAPSLVWALGALSIILAPVMVLLSLWLYTVVFVFSSAWFTHYLLDALVTARARSGPGGAADPPDANVSVHAHAPRPSLPPSASALPALPDRDERRPDGSTR